MTIEIKLPLEAFSINRKSSRDMRFTTSAYKDWATRVVYFLENSIELKQLGVRWLNDGGQFHVEYHFIYPGNKYYNAKGDISSKVYDLTNVEKPLQDLIFDTMGVNDKYVTKLISTKEPGADYQIKILLKLLPL